MTSLLCIHTGKLRPTNNDVPSMKIFLDEFRLTYCRFDSPTAVTMPVIKYKGTVYVISLPIEKGLCFCYLLIFFFKKKNTFGNYIRVSNS